MQTFNRAIKTIHHLILDNSFKDRFRLCFQDFTSRRCLTCQSTVFSILDLNKRSLQINLNSLSLQLNVQNVTKQAFSLARQKVSYLAFKFLNETIIYNFYNTSTPKLYNNKYLLLAIDGSTLYLPNTKELSDYFSKARNATAEVVLARTSILYDVLNKIVLDVRIAPYKTSEKTMFLEHLEWILEKKIRSYKKIILLLDSGYPCIGLFLLLRKLQIDFICCSHPTKNKDVRDQLGDFMDREVTTSANNKDRRESARTYLGLSKEEKIEIEDCKLRAIKSGEKILITSLMDRNKFKPKKIRSLYRKRWGVETAYRTIKIDTLVENFSGRTLQAILQEFYVAILIQNLARMLEIDLSKSNNKRGCVINHREVLGVLRVCLQEVMRGVELQFEKIILAAKIHWERQVGNRSYPRKKGNNAPRNRARRLCYA
jgi:hypothetical protein